MSKELEMAKELVKVLEEKEKNCKCKCSSTDVALSELLPGDTFKIGDHDFIVLEQYESLGKTKVISKGFMLEDVVFDFDARDYGKSNLKKKIESEILPIISESIGAENIVEHEVDLTSVDMQHEFESCICKVRPITFDEAREYNELIVNKELDDWWWTCTPWSSAERGYKYRMSVVSPSGCIYDGIGCNDDGGVRPVCILKSNIFVSKGDK